MSATKQISPLIDLTKGMTDTAFLMTPDRKIEDFNRLFVKLHDVDREKIQSLRGSFCRDSVNLEICESSCVVQQVMASGASVRFDEVKGKSRNGEELNLIVSGIPIKDESGKVVNILEIHRDVTDEAHIHDKYKVLLDKEKRAKEELERLVDERTKELRKANEDLKRAESQLVHSEKMSSLGQMVAGIAHELNNPINFIAGNVDILEDYASELKQAFGAISALVATNSELSNKLKALNDEQEIEFKLDDLVKMASSIEKGSERAADIIQGLRTFSRLDEASLKETDLHQDIDTTLMLLQNEYKNRVEIVKEFGKLPQVRCYASQLNQVFMNLIHNAIQAIEGKGTIWIRTREEGSNVVIEIADTGGGIPPELQKKIFDPFFTTKAVGKGTGLGLSITYGIIERHKGKIEVDSTVGKGTTFRVIIPRNASA